MSDLFEPHAEPDRLEQVAERIFRLPLRTVTLPPATRTNTYLVGTDDGWLVVDAGPSDREGLDVLERTVRAVCGTSSRVRGLLLTHHHPDHVGGLAWWREVMRRPVLATRNTFDLLGIDNVPDSFEVTGGASFGGAEVVSTPGHASGHVSLLVGADLVAGDLIAGLGTILVDRPDGDMAHYMASLELAAARTDGAAFPAHGPGTHHGRDRILQTLEHRRFREQLVLFATRECQGGQLEAIAARAYAESPAAPRIFTERATLAHLDKLIADGAVVRRPNGHYQFDGR
jgi:glyoxylase-like metal-dependent hydrolase (beta-lactamase superfamily II)